MTDTTTLEQPKVLTPLTLGGLKVVTPGDQEMFMNILIYGNPGVGKTVFAASACEVANMSPVLIIDVEGGTMSLQRTHPSVSVVRIKNFADFNQLYADLRAGKHGFKTIVLDSISEIQKFGMYSAMAKALQDNPERDPDLPGIGEWGKNTEQIRKLVRAFRDLPTNCIVTALEANDKTPEGVIRRTYPNLSNKLALELPGFFDVVGYMYIKEKREKQPNGADKIEQVRCLLTMATSRQVAKDRTGILPPVIEYPTMQLIDQLVHA